MSQDAPPLSGEFATKAEAHLALGKEILFQMGKSIKYDRACSGGNDGVFRCPSAITGKTMTVPDDFQPPPREEGENQLEYNKRKRQAAEEAAKQAGLCPFKAVVRRFKCRRTGETKWRFDTLANGATVIPHSEQCEAGAVLTGSLLRSFLEAEVRANPDISGPGVIKALTAPPSTIRQHMMPSKSTLYRVLQAVKNDKAIVPSAANLADNWQGGDRKRGRRSKFPQEVQEFIFGLMTAKPSMKPMEALSHVRRRFPRLQGVADDQQIKAKAGLIKKQVKKLLQDAAAEM
eukprot:CAMPEP_0195527078 /NCGR_PEP_ID=MMETSP0794_2-20130614/28524_1 /TAXON_ID=515487 /ORGANISM="Stephanopyxis turris, Strain CCMP 815" /LENGTH=288 /DNA_ID=CAMNT_0040657907 /DNA_START=55 /DNA_END=921 /DNA_ORIENTATION=+